MSTVQEIKSAITSLSQAERDELAVWLRQDGNSFDPDEDSAELEGELLKAASGPHTPYSSAGLRARSDAVIRQSRA